MTCISILFPDWLLTHSMGTAARVAVATGGSPVGNYSMIVFTSWDYGCLGDRATKLKQKNIHYRLQVRGDLSHLAGWRTVMKKRNVVDMLQFFNHSLYVTCFQMTPRLFSLSLSGGSGGGKHKEKGSRSDFVSKNCFILSTCLYGFSCSWAYCGSPLRDL